MARTELAELADTAACALIDLADALERAGQLEHARECDPMISAVAAMYRRMCTCSPLWATGHDHPGSPAT